MTNGSAAPSAAPMQRGEQRDQQDLGAIDRENAAAGGAERLQRSDHIALARKMACDRIGDADAADQKRGQADQREELGEALDIAFELRRGLAAGADFPAGVAGTAPAPVFAAPPRRRRSHRVCGKRRRYCQRTRLPGCSSPVARSAASLIEHARSEARCRRRACPARSVSAARSSIVALPMVMRSPVFRSSRVNSVGSTAAPKAPPFCANSAASGIAGSVATAPNSG